MSIDRTKYLDAAEVQQLIAATKARTTKTGRLAWMVVDFALNTGLRVSEIALVRIEDIDFNRGLIHVTRLKRRKAKKQDVIPIADLKEHLKEYIGDRKSGPLFVGQRGSLSSQGLQHIWYRSIFLAGLPKISIHGARHTLGTLLYKKTKNLRLVQKQLGHVKPSTTAIYADVSFEDMQDGLNGLYG
jgi:integrase